MIHRRIPLLLRSSWLALAAIVLITNVALAGPESGWEKKVPEAERGRTNPVASDPDATTSGGKLYAEKCAKCHGDNAEGKGHHPSLRTQSVQQATPGELQWMIEHGNRWHGMPGFGSLSENQRWQLVSYIKSLGVAAK